MYVFSFHINVFVKRLKIFFWYQNITIIDLKIRINHFTVTPIITFFESISSLDSACVFIRFTKKLIINAKREDKKRKNKDHCVCLCAGIKLTF